MYYRFEQQQIIPKPITDVFIFFSDARNLAILTPDWLNFKILTPNPIEMETGLLLDYQIRWMGIPFHWRTEIIEWQPNHWFTDRQIKGPFKFWVHTHTFEQLDNGHTLMLDVVDYGMPLGPIGSLTRRLLVKNQVHHIFDFRANKIKEIIG